jgi:hypothetical protein
MMPYGRCRSSLQLTGTQTSGTTQAIARLPGRPALSGTIGEFVAARVSGIDLLTSGSMRVQRRLPGLTGPSGQARVGTGTRMAAHRLIRGLADAKWLSQ